MLLVKETVFNLKEEATQHWFSYSISNCSQILKTF